MRKAETIAKEIKSKGFKSLEDPEFKTLSNELHIALTWERNSKGNKTNGQEATN